MPFMFVANKYQRNTLQSLDMAIFFNILTYDIDFLDLFSHYKMKTFLKNTSGKSDWVEVGGIKRVNDCWTSQPHFLWEFYQGSSEIHYHVTVANYYSILKCQCWSSCPQLFFKVLITSYSFIFLIFNIYSCLSEDL